MLILACLPIGDARDASSHLIEAIEQVEYVLLRIPESLPDYAKS